MHEYDDGVTRTKLVSALDVAHALARELELATGLLPRDALWWARTPTGVRVAVWREPRVWAVRLKAEFGARPRRFKLPMPGLVFVCGPRGVDPHVFAAAARPRGPRDQLFCCPTYNVFRTGRICTGTHPFPADADRVPDAFFESFFSRTGDTAGGKSRRHPEDVGELWAELDGEAEFPVDDLVPQLTVADAMRLGA